MVFLPKFRHLVFFCVLCLFPFFIYAQQPVAPADYTGSRTTTATNQLVTFGGYSGSIKIAWSISFSSSINRWNYTYTVTNATGGSIGQSSNYLFVEVPKGAYNAEFVNTGSAAMVGTSYVSVAGEYELEFHTTSSTLVASFTSQFAPVWADGGYTNTTNLSSGVFDYAFGQTSYLGANFNQWLAVPAGARVNIPEPQTWLILGSLLALVAFIRRKKSNTIAY